MAISFATFRLVLGLTKYSRRFTSFKVSFFSTFFLNRLTKDSKDSSLCFFSHNLPSNASSFETLGTSGCGIFGFFLCSS